jgi:hypothetical protein
MYVHDTSFYQAANSRAGIAAFDAHLAAEIQTRRPDLSQDLKRISAAILSAPLSSLTPLLPSSAPLAVPPASVAHSASPSHPNSHALTRSQRDIQKGVQAAPSVVFEHNHHPSDYNVIFEKHAAPTAHFPQQEEAWIHFAASGASFGGKTKEQKEAVKKVFTQYAHSPAITLLCAFDSRAGAHDGSAVLQGPPRRYCEG